jgi:hypothetical protein
VGITYAWWRKDGFDAPFVISELAKGVSAPPGGGLRFSGDAFFGDPLILLETGVEFSEPISDVDRSGIIDRALVAALRSTNFNPKVLIAEMNKATHDFVLREPTKYVMATGLSFRHFENISRRESSGCSLYVRDRFPRYLARSRKEAKLRSRESVRGDYPENSPFERYAAAWIHVRGRSPTEAIDRAVEALELRRGIWNFALNRGTGVPFPAPIRGPINEVRAGPLYSLHSRDGSLAAEYDWFDPEYSEPRLSRKAPQRWDEVRKDEEGVYILLKRSPYRATLEDALRRYCRALDLADLSRAFLELWSLLEALTGLTPNEGYDKVIKRASFIFADEQRKTHEQVLYHLRRHRNSYVHAGEGSNKVGTYLHQLRRYVEYLLRFHLVRSRHFSSQKRATRFLDLPTDKEVLRRMIEDQMESARLARDGLRFHERG